MLFTTLLLLTSIAQAQTKSFSFTPTQLKKIAIELESKELLEKDTAAYRFKIRTFELKTRVLDSIISSMIVDANLSSNYIDVIEDDYDNLYVKYKDLGLENKKLRTKVKATRSVGLPLAIAIGAIVGILITK